MSLLSRAMTPCTKIVKTSGPDGRGGSATQWVDGEEFDAAIVFDSSTQAKIANAAGVKDLYTVTTSRSVTLNYHDVFRRESDNKIFRCTSKGDERKTPASASLDMRQVSAEEYTLTGADNG